MLNRSRLWMTLFVAVVGLTWMTAPQVAQAGKKKPKPPKIATGPMDDGKLDPFWFGEGLEFREADEIDYLWVKEGFKLDGRQLHFVSWPDPDFRGDAAEDRDEDDYALAKSMAGALPKAFAETFAREMAEKNVSTSLSEGDVLVEGRIVDCSTGSTAAKVWVGFGAGSGNTTIDLRFSDAASGELLVGIHHRVVSGSELSTTDSKFMKWIGKLAEIIEKKGLAKLYAKGDPVNK